MGKLARKPQRSTGVGPKLLGLQYYGGKFRMAPWIVSRLPYDARGMYVEPFCGMANIFMQRKPCLREILNDLNDRIVNWFFAIRDHHKEFARLLRNTPRARRVFEWSAEHVDSPDMSIAERACCLSVLLSWGMNHADANASWAPKYANSNVRDLTKLADRLPLIRDRLRNASIENIDAIELLNRVADYQDAVVYCDPPYTTANTTPYGLRAVNVPLLTRALQAQRGAVAISGYNQEWDHLGWQRHEWSGRAFAAGGGGAERVEVLWTNYEVARG